MPYATVKAPYSTDSRNRAIMQDMVVERVEAVCHRGLQTSNGQRDHREIIRTKLDSTLGSAVATSNVFTIIAGRRLYGLLEGRERDSARCVSSRAT